MITQHISFPLFEEGYHRYDHHLKVHRDPERNSHYFFCCQFSMTNGQLGHMGLLTDMVTASGENVKAVAVWLVNGTHVTPERPLAQINDTLYGEPGRCLCIPFEWQKGLAYRISMVRYSRENEGCWWRFSVQAAGMDELTIGKIFLPDHGQIAEQVFVSTTCLLTDHPSFDGKPEKSVSVEFFDPIMYVPEVAEAIPPAVSVFEKPCFTSCKITRGEVRFSSLQSITIPIPAERLEPADPSTLPLMSWRSMPEKPFFKLFLVGVFSNLIHFFRMVKL